MPASIYTDELADTICTRLVEGESLRAICRDETMPGARTVFDWLESSEAFRSKYARAKEIQADLGFDELQEIADEGNPQDVQRARLRADTLRWRLSKLAPKKYGDKVAHVGGGPGEPAMTFQVLTGVPRGED